MKHLYLLLLLVVNGYFVWVCTPDEQREALRRVASHHGLRLLALVAIVLLLVAAAVYFPATPDPHTERCRLAAESSLVGQFDALVIVKSV